MRPPVRLNDRRAGGGPRGVMLSNSLVMDGEEWINEVQRRALDRAPGVEASRPESETLTLSVGLRAVVLHDVGEVVLFSPSFAAGGSIGSRLQDRVQHLDITTYGINESTVDIAVDDVLGHLRT